MMKSKGFYYLYSLILKYLSLIVNSIIFFIQNFFWLTLRLSKIPEVTGTKRVGSILNITCESPYENRRFR